MGGFRRELGGLTTLANCTVEGRRGAGEQLRWRPHALINDCGVAQPAALVNVVASGLDGTNVVRTNRRYKASRVP